MDREESARILKDVVIYRSRSDVPPDVVEAIDVAMRIFGEEPRMDREEKARLEQLENTGRALLDAKHRDAGVMGPDTLAAFGEFGAVLRGGATPADQRPGYVVITFGGELDEDQRPCELNQCPMAAVRFASAEEAEQYMASMPEWTAPHRLPLSAPLADRPH